MTPSPLPGYFPKKSPSRCTLQLAGWREASGPTRCTICRRRDVRCRLERLQSPARLEWRCKHHRAPKGLSYSSTTPFSATDYFAPLSSPDGWGQAHAQVIQDYRKEQD